MAELAEFAARYAGGALREALAGADRGLTSELTEIRIRVDKPLILKTLAGEYFAESGGGLSGCPEKAYRPTDKDIKQTLELISNYSLYAFQDEIRKGFITIPGGHRVGLAGQCVMEGGHIKLLKNINSLCVRVSRQVKGCAGGVMDFIRAGPDLFHTLIISPPGCGKTTLLRDIIRLLSERGVTVGVADERGEIAGAYLGRAVNDLGPRTDVAEGCKKTDGMLMLLRSMGPDVIAADEIGTREELDVILDVMNAGVRLICTLHGEDPGASPARPLLKEILERGVFRRFIVLGREPAPGTVTNIYNEHMENIFKDKTLGLCL